jgi:hypothetical protein
MVRFASCMALVLGAAFGLSPSFAGEGTGAGDAAPVDAAPTPPPWSPRIATNPERTYEAGSLIIPMDECHQYAGDPDRAASRTSPRCYCPSSTADDGVIKSYGLMYRLLENGIHVAVAIDDAKTEIGGVDFSITAAEPVKLYNRTSNSSTSFFKRGTSCANASASSPNVKMDYRGAPWIIPAADAPTALALIRSGSSGIGGRGAFSASTFSTVDVHVAQTAFTAKVARTYRGAPKPIALLDLDAGGGLGGNSGYDVLTDYLTAAGLNTTGAGGSACTPGTIFGTFSTNADFLNDCLVRGDYATLWAPHWEATGNTQLDQVVAKIGEFVDNGKALFAECAAIQTFEGAFDAPAFEQGDYSISITSASYSSTTKKVTVVGTTYPSASVTFRSSKSSTTCGAAALATITATSTGAFTWTSSAFASASAAPCRVSVDSMGAGAAMNVSGNACSPASTYTCSASTTYAGPSCGSPDVDAPSTGHFMTSNGLIANVLGGVFGTYGDGSSEGWIYRDVANIYLQKGDLKFENPYGTIRHWKTAAPPRCRVTTNTAGATGDSIYRPDVTRLISSCDGSDYDATNGRCLRSATDATSAFVDHESEWDTFTYTPHKDGDPAKGPIIYLGGHDYNGTPAGVRLVLNTVFNLQYEVEPEDPPTPIQLVRSSPIVAPVDGVETYVQGSFITYRPDETAQTFDPARPDAFIFPYRTGHVYGYDARNISSSATAYQDLGAPLWDAAGGVPASGAAGCGAFDGNCRTIFTNTATGASPPRVMFDSNGRSTFGALLGGSLSTGSQTTLVGLVHAGRPDTNGVKQPALGGVDRSTLALIESSRVANATRPAMIYVGGLDGMLHAICAERRGRCTAIGRELWAYLPRTQLGRLRFNTQKVQGSPKVGDFLANFDGVAGLEWRTMLVFQVGSGNPADATAAPAVIGIDVTDPFDPKLEFEIATPSTRGATAFGTGLDLALGPVRIDNQVQPAVFVSTNNGGTGGSGVHVMAYSAIDGRALWAQPFAHVYPAPRVAASGTVPASGIPGGIAAFDNARSGVIDRLAVPTLYGELYVLDAATGANVYGSVPLFRFSQDKKPIGAAPAVYRADDGAHFAVIVSGGYVDDDGATWSAGQQYIVAVKLDIESPTGLPMNETGPDSTNRPFVEPIAGSAYAQPTIAGGELFVVTATTDINDIDPESGGSGSMIRMDLGTGQVIATYALGSSGASSVDVTSGTAYISGVVNTMKIEIGPTFDSHGAATELVPTSRGHRRMWITITE